MSRLDYRDELFGKPPFPEDEQPAVNDVVAECVRSALDDGWAEARKAANRQFYGGNPKDAEARRTGKPRLDLLEPVAEREIAKALAFGADKYGVRNFVTAPINARVYVAAMKRHIDAWLDGEDYADDSGAHHLGHIGANVHVALAAMAAGTFVDDRGVSEAKDDSIGDPAKVVE